MKMVYVTGTSGMIGAEVARHFFQLAPDQLTTVSRRPCPLLPVTQPRQREVRSIFDVDWYDSADSNSTIIHCAGLSDPRAEFSSFSVLAREHIVPHVEMIEAILARGWRGRLVYISSGGTIYGDVTKLPISEQVPPNPKSFYGLQKYCIERAYSHLAQTRGFELVLLRVSNPYGSLMMKSGQGVIPILINALRTGQLFTILGDGSALRDYVEISDLCRAIERAATQTLTDTVNVLNIGSGIGVSLNQLITTLSETVGAELNSVRVPVQYDVKSNVLDCTKAAEVLGWRPEITLDQGLATLFRRLDQGVAP